MSTIERHRTVSKLKSEFAALSPRMKIVAKYIIDNQTEFGLNTIRETAYQAGVSTYTLVRLAERLGYAGYEQMRGPFRQALLAGAEIRDVPDWITDPQSDGPAPILANTAENAIVNLQRSLRWLDHAQLSTVADLLLESRQVFVTGIRASYCAAYLFHYVGQMILPNLHLIPRHMNTAVDDLQNAGPGDVVLAVTLAPYSRETVEACQFAQKKGAKLVLVADSDLVAPDLQAEHMIRVASANTYRFASYTAVVAVIEALMAVLIDKDGDAAQENIRAYETVRSEHNAYWTRPKKQ